MVGVRVKCQSKPRLLWHFTLTPFRYSDAFVSSKTFLAMAIPSTATGNPP
jgi:hypothetical protein